MLARRDISGGRELKPGEQLNVAEAERQLATASRNSEYTKELAAQQQRETDPQKRKFIEAVLLDSFEYTAARDLRLQQMSAVQ